jgi:putative exosortase-associated protein (TIGR04073 family)
MRIVASLLAVAAVAALTGCAGPEQKFGRGMNNLTEIARGGEMQRAIEQTTLWDGTMQGKTVGWARGFTRTMTRTGIGLYEVVTFPIPPYRPVMVQKGPMYPDASVVTRKPSWGGLELSEKPVFPSSYTPGMPAAGKFDTDNRLGFSGGDVAPGFPGSRFSVLDP